MQKKSIQSITAQICEKIIFGMEMSFHLRLYGLYTLLLSWIFMYTLFVYRRLSVSVMICQIEVSKKESHSRSRFIQGSERTG